MKAIELVEFLSEHRKQHPHADKPELSEAVSHHFNLDKHRSVFANDHYAIRFSSCSGSSFSNVVLSLSALRQFDDRPFIICVVRQESLEFLLANTTFIKKVSHSSHQLRVDNIKGSFLGHDIIREYDGIDNCPANFEKLWEIHSEFSWNNNLVRLVESTNNILPTGVRFTPTISQVRNILHSPSLANSISSDQAYNDLITSIYNDILGKRESILHIANIDNVNLRGNQIEQVITGGGNVHGLADRVYTLPSSTELYLEIKTKLLDRSSSPKAYNIDKALEILSRGNAIIAFCFVGVDIVRGNIVTKVLSIFDEIVLDATRIQFHWAGRNSRGVTQLTGDFSSIFSDRYREHISVEKARSFLERLIQI